jgi:hypothetical protein
MKSITTLAVLLLIGIAASLLALNYYVNFYKPQKQAEILLKSPVTSSVDFPKDSVKVISDIVAPIAATTLEVPVPTNSTATKSVVHPTTTPKQTTHVPKRADIAVVPPTKLVLPAKVVPKTVAPDAGITAKGSNSNAELGLTKGDRQFRRREKCENSHAKLPIKKFKHS